jgi:hypothetical protein
MNIILKILGLKYIQLIPPIILIYQCYLNEEELRFLIKKSLNSIDNFPNAIIYFIISLISYLLIHIFVRGNTIISSICFVTLSILINSIFNFYTKGLISIILYIGGIYWISKIIVNYFIRINKFLEVCTFSLLINFILIQIIFAFDINIEYFLYLFSCLGGIYYLYLFTNKLSALKLWFSNNIKINKPTLTISDFGNILILTLLLEYCLMLLNQPILEWDSNVGHIPLMNYYLQDKTLAPNPHILQSFFINFHQISSIFFFYALDEIGLKYFNLFYIIFTIIVYYNILLYIIVSRKNNNQIVLILFSIITVPLLITQIGTFQYDISLPSIYGLTLYYTMNYIFSNQYIEKKKLTLLISISILIGIYIKLNFIASVIPISIYLIYYNLKNKSLFNKSNLLSLSLLIIGLSFIIIKSYYYTGLLFHPYQYMKEITKSDWSNYGIQDSNILYKTIYYIIGFTFTDKYGHYYKYTGGFIFFLSYISIMKLDNKKKIFIYFISIFSIFFSIIETQYARYFIYILSIFPIIFINKINNNINKYLFYPIIYIVILFQILMIPEMNWWIKLNANSLYSEYNVNIYEESIRGEDFLFFKDIIKSLDNTKTLFFVNRTGDRFYFAMKEKNKTIIPMLWQSNIESISNAKDSGFIDECLKYQFKYIIIPNPIQIDLYETYKNYYEIIVKDGKVIRSNKLFILIKIK